MTTSEQNYAALRRLHEATNEAVRRLEAENAALRAEVVALDAQKRQWQAERAVQGQVIQEALTRANATSNAYLREVERLRAALQGAQG